MLDVRGINTAGKLVATVQGTVDEIDQVLAITRIHLKFQLAVDKGQQPTVDRALNSFASKCPAYQSVKDCIACTWEAEITEN